MNAQTSAPSPGPWQRSRAWIIEHSGELCASLVGAVWFFYLGYGPTLLPTHIAWMYRDDWSAYLWGWLFYRNADWALPLGNTPELFWPYGTSVGFTDANPWAAVLFKLLSPILPFEFQFCGLWFLLCFVLQGYFGARVTATFSNDKVAQTLGGALFALTPLLPSRHPHIALSGFFFITYGVYLNLRPLASREQAKRTFIAALLMVIWVAGTHGYLSVMLLALAIAFCLRLRVIRLASWLEAGAGALAMVGATLGTYYLFGLIGWKQADLTAEGFGQFSGDLTTFINSQGWSRYVPPLPYRGRQWEGFSYLGLGVFALLLILVPLSAFRPKRTASSLYQSWPLVLMLFAMWFYSLSSSIALFGEEVYNLSAFYDHFEKLTGIFRSSGRFSWPLHLSLIAAGISGVCSLRSAWLRRVILLCAVLVQGREMVTDRLSFADIPMSKLEHPAWSTANQHYKHIQTVPLHLQWVCPFDIHLVNRLSYVAYRWKLTMNSGNIMRKEPNPLRLCEQHIPREAALDKQTIYVVGPRYMTDFMRPDALCGRIDGLVACVAKGVESELAQALEITRVGR